LEIFNRGGENLKDNAPFKDFPDERIDNLKLIRTTMYYGIACMLAYPFEFNGIDSDEDLAWRIQTTSEVL
jgi:hypothetical protein